MNHTVRNAFPLASLLGSLACCIARGARMRTRISGSNHTSGSCETAAT